MTFPKDITDHHKEDLKQKCFYLVGQFKDKAQDLYETYKDRLATLKVEDSWDFYHELLVEYQKLTGSNETEGTAAAGGAKKSKTAKVTSALKGAAKTLVTVAALNEAKKAVQKAVKKATAKKAAKKSAAAPAKATSKKATSKKATAKKAPAKKATAKKATAKKVVSKKATAKKAPAKKATAKKATAKKATKKASAKKK